MWGQTKLRLPEPEEALRGREHRPFALPEAHMVLGTPLDGPVPAGHAEVVLGMGCFWGAEQRFWELDGVFTTAVGYAGGLTPNPTYEEVCTGLTGHTEVVRVVFDRETLPYADLWRAFWEGHDPTQGMRQGNDVGTQYRSVIYLPGSDRGDARASAEASLAVYQKRLWEAGLGEITTEIGELSETRPLYYAEGYHQQYLAKNPNGYCGLGGCGVAYEGVPPI